MSNPKSKIQLQNDVATFGLLGGWMALENVLHGKRPRKRKLPFRIAAKVVVFVKSYF